MMTFGIEQFPSLVPRLHICLPATLVIFICCLLFWVELSFPSPADKESFYMNVHLA